MQPLKSGSVIICAAASLFALLAGAVQAQTICELPCVITGIIGPQGPAGAAGPQGPQGEPGAAGPAGPTGVALLPPGGRGSLVSDKSVMTSDVVSSTLYYPRHSSNRIPVLDASMTWQTFRFTASATAADGLAMAGGAKWVAGSKYDAFANADGVMCTGPAWPASDTAARRLIQYDGIWVNDAALTCDTSATTLISCPQYRCTYLTSIAPSVTGQLSANFGYGRDRKMEVWTPYVQNQIPIVMHVGAANGTCKPTNQYNDAPLPNFAALCGDTLAKGTVFTGLPTVVDAIWHEAIFADSATVGQPSGALTAVGWDGVPVGFWGKASFDSLASASLTPVAHYVNHSAVGVHAVSMMVAKANNPNSTVYGAAGYPWPLPDFNSAMFVRYQG